MTKRRRFEAWIGLCWALSGAAIGTPIAHAAEWNPVALSDSLGLEIDESERAEYHLLPEISGFVSAQFFMKDASAYRCLYRYRQAGLVLSKSIGLSAEAWELTRLHANLVEQYRTKSAAPDSGGASEWQYLLALKFGSEARYEVSRPLLQDMATEFPGSMAAGQAQTTLQTIDRLSRSAHGLYLPGGLHDQEGRTHLLIFAGYYGIWVGLAVPIWAEADTPQAYAAGLLVAAPASFLIANGLTRNSGISEGKAWMISLGGNLGTWQGIGWSSLGDTEENQIVGIGLLAGLAGIAGAVTLTNRVHFSEGHAAVTNASLLWGGWFGFVAATLAGAEDDALLRASLIGSDALVLGSGIAARNVRMSNDRMRVINVMGVIGTAFGFGLDLLFEVDDSDAALGIASVGSIVGLAVGANVTRDYDRGKYLSIGATGERDIGLTFAPHISILRDDDDPRAARPMFGARASF